MKRYRLFYLFSVLYKNTEKKCRKSKKKVLKLEQRITIIRIFAM